MAPFFSLKQCFIPATISFDCVTQGNEHLAKTTKQRQINRVGRKIHSLPLTEAASHFNAAIWEKFRKPAILPVDTKLKIDREFCEKQKQ